MLKDSLKGIVIIFLASLLLSGCNFNENNSDNLISKSKKLIVKDISSEFIINAKNLATYKYKDDPNVSYVNICEFITFMDGGIVNLNISKNDNMIISYTLDVPREYQQIYGESYTFEMTLDATNEVISYNDFDMVSVLNVPPISQYDTELSLSNVEITDDDPSIDIDLSSYGMDIVLYKDEYYIPLYLANLFFTGSSINVYEMNDYIYVIDNLSDFSRLINKFEKDDSISASDISFHTNNYLALYFDYFYGLKNYKNIDTYLNILENYNFKEIYDFNSLHKELENFIANQDDLHTSLISAGYMNEDYRPSRVNSNKLSNYLNAYKNNKCYTRTSEVNYGNYEEDTFVIKVNAFSRRTKALLKTAMEQAKNYDDIIIDVSCNPGGNIVGVFELLGYMTDEEIQVSYLNSITGSETTEYYETTSNALLDKNFYVYTSAATFSAANLFASIVKDQELGIIFGENTSGGASAITYTVLPDGAIIVNSSTMTFINEDGEVIEDGIEVDMNYQYPFNWFDLIADLNNMFAYLSEISIDKDSTIDSIIYDFDIDRNSEIINITDYKLSVYDYKNNELFYEELFTLDDFTYMLNKVEGNNVYNVELSVRYNVNNIAKEEIIYRDVIDDHSNNFDLNATEIPIGEEFSAYSHDLTDKDAFKFTVLEDGLYRIEVNENQELNQHSVYDEDGNLIGEGFDFHLAPGNYYLVASINNIGDYYIKIRKLDIENIYVGQETSTIISNSNVVDYFEFYSSEMKTYRMNISGSIRGEYTIFDSEGNRIARYAYHSFFFTVTEGTYTIKVESDFLDEKINLLITETQVQDDVVNSFYLPIEYYNVIKMDFVNIIDGKINYNYDMDVYIINIESSGYYKLYLYGDGMRVFCVDENGESQSWTHEGRLFLETGTYYLGVTSRYGDEYTVAYDKD